MSSTEEASNLSELDLLSNFCADLLAEEHNEPIVMELLGKPAGQWQRVNALTVGREIKTTLAMPSQTDDLFVSWLEPPVPADATFVLVWFQVYSNERMWSTTAVYNRKRLMESHRIDRSRMEGD